MKKIQGMYIPDRDNHFIRYMDQRSEIGFGTYHYDRLLKSLKYVRDFNCAIDVGAHIGMWSVPLSRKFKKVIAFEPDPENFKCLVKNSQDRFTMHICALGNTTGSVFIEQDLRNTGKNYVDVLSGHNQVPILKLDSFHLEPDYIKIDCEGYEYFVLQGAEETLKKHHPVVIVEVGPSENTDRYGINEKDSLVFLESLGAVVRENIRHDYILSWDD